VILGGVEASRGRARSASPLAADETLQGASVVGFALLDSSR
jgi:hypothetical protein